MPTMPRCQKFSCHLGTESSRLVFAVPGVFLALRRGRLLSHPPFLLFFLHELKSKMTCQTPRWCTLFFPSFYPLLKINQTYIHVSFCDPQQVT